MRKLSHWEGGLLHHWSQWGRMGGCWLCLLETEGEKNAISGGGIYLLLSQGKVLTCAGVLQTSAFRYLL